MSDFQQRPNSGLLKPNFRKKLPKHPDYFGTCMVNGVEMEMSGWIKKGTRGELISIAFQPPRPKANNNGLPSANEVPPGESPSPTGSAEHEPEDADKNIPF